MTLKDFTQEVVVLFKKSKAWGGTFWASENGIFGEKYL